MLTNGRNLVLNPNSLLPSLCYKLVEVPPPYYPIMGFHLPDLVLLFYYCKVVTVYL